MKYYEFTLDNFPNCSYIFLFGGRSSGKSTSVAKYLKEKYDADKSEFVRVFRNYTAMRSATTWFSLFNDETTDIVFDRQKYLYNGVLFGHGIALSNEEVASKSSQYPNVDTIVFDEFVMIDPYGYYPNEPEHFMSIVSTVFRNRSGTVIFIGNNMNEMSKYNPFFRFFGLDWEAVNPKLGETIFWNASGFENGAKCAMEFIPVAYESEDEIPEMQRVAGNDVATTGSFKKDPEIKPQLFKDYHWIYVFEYNKVKMTMGFSVKNRCLLIGEYHGKHARNRPRINTRSVDTFRFYNSKAFTVAMERIGNKWGTAYENARVKAAWLDIIKGEV